MTSSTDQLTAEWEEEAAKEKAAALAPIPRPQLPDGVIDRSIRGEDIDAFDVLPDEKWADVPYLPADIAPMMIEQETPFRMVGYSRRTSEFGPVWKIVMDFEGRVFSFVLGGKEKWRNEKMERIAAVLDAGARSVGPFILVETDTGKGNPFKDIRAVAKSHKAHSNKLQQAGKK